MSFQKLTVGIAKLIDDLGMIIILINDQLFHHGLVETDLNDDYWFFLFLNKLLLMDHF
jgi:hypothetical protein